MLIGLDDTDDTTGMCTTYLATKICQELDVVGYPKLVRLNPNIPYKTRGNGAVSLQVEDDNCIDYVLAKIKEYAKLNSPSTNPGAVFINRDTPPTKVVEFYKRAVSELVDIGDAKKIIEEIDATGYGFNNGRGIVGALASTGFTGVGTYELIAYRIRSNYGSKRRIDENSVREMHERLYPRVFDSIDSSKNKVLITPRGNDPVFCGIRGVDEQSVIKAWDIVNAHEEIESIQVYETNQATDAHVREKRISDIKPYDCVKVKGKIVKTPEKIRGGHVLFSINDETGSMDCAAYKKTGGLRDVVAELSHGDVVTVYGGIGRHGETINLEKIRIDRLVEKQERIKIYCCGRIMKSTGKNSRIRCRKCSRQEKKKMVSVDRGILEGYYEAAAEARRHLSSPLALNRQYLR